MTASETAAGVARLASIDAYRGAVMLLMASHDFGIGQVAEHFPHSALWQAAEFQVSHVPWRGCALWDLIQPSFMFLVGVSAVYSYSARAARGQSYGRMLGHAIVRAMVLVALGIFLRSDDKRQTNFTFEDVLTQIGLGYIFLFLLWDKGWRIQLAAALAILVAYWALFAAWPLPGSDFDDAKAGWEQDYEPLTGFERHWEKNANAASDFDRWFLNLFPRERRFEFNGGGYLTLNFVPALATMIFGLIAGGILRGSPPRFLSLASEKGPSGDSSPADSSVDAHNGWRKFSILLAMGLALLAAGLLWDWSGTCPLVKRIWTPSWALFSAGAATLLLAGFYALVDRLGFRKPAFPLIVIGMNSILMYLMAELAAGWIAQQLTIHFGAGVFDFLGSQYAPIVQSSLVLLVMGLICYWLYRQRIFLRI